MNILFKIIHDIVIFAWDASLTMINIITPKKKQGYVVPEGHPGFGGIWPEYVAPNKDDSRCSCPALNTLANHGNVLFSGSETFFDSWRFFEGILPHDGKNIQFKEMGQAIRNTYNFSSTYCYFVPHYAAQMLGKDYNHDTISLSELDMHNGIEHDASLCRKSPWFSTNLSSVWYSINRWRYRYQPKSRQSSCGIDHQPLILCIW